MRIPEYRGFVKDLTIRPQWISGSHIYDNRDPAAPRHLIRRFGDGQPFEVMPETLQQYTGCRDDALRNKVFEGDILRVDGESVARVVVWDEDQAGFDVVPPVPAQSMEDGGYVPFFEWAQGLKTWYEVVGNSVQIVDEVFPSEIPRRVKV